MLNWPYVFDHFRAVHIQPNRFVGVVGDHDDDFPVENLALSRDKTILASCSHDQKIKFWNIESVKKEKVNTKKRATKADKTKFLKSSNKGDFFADLAEDEGNNKPSGSKDNDSDSDDDDNDDSDDDE